MNTFNELIDIEVKTTTKNSLGEDVDTWAVFVKVGANIVQLSQQDSVNTNTGADETESISIKIETWRTSQTYNLNSATHRIRTIGNGHLWEIINVDDMTLRNRNMIRIFARRYIS